jgi:uncharacterized membrane protein
LTCSCLFCFFVVVAAAPFSFKKGLLLLLLLLLVVSCRNQPSKYQHMQFWHLSPVAKIANEVLQHQYLHVIKLAIIQPRHAGQEK